MMKAIKKQLLGISIILFGSTIACSNSSDDILVYVGWGTALVGLIVSLIGYFMRENK